MMFPSFMIFRQNKKIIAAQLFRGLEQVSPELKRRPLSLP
jgi:hypothetical protein